MTEQEFQAIRAELERLSCAINIAVGQIVSQKATIDALGLILEQKRLVSPQELERARSEAAKELKGRGQ